MPATRTTKKPSTKSAPKSSAKAPAKSAEKSSAKPSAKSTAGRMSLDETMAALEKAGSEQTRKTYRRHGAQGPMFGVSFATLKTMVKKIGVDHDLAHELWATKNHDARVLAYKIADPALVRPADLDRWAGSPTGSCGGYLEMLAAESPHGAAKAREWLAADDERLRAMGWTLLSRLACLDEQSPDDWFEKRIAEIEKSIHSAPNAERGAMNQALITIGGRSPALRKAATAAAKRIGKVEVDHGDTSCKTPDAASYIAKMWAHSESKDFASPAAQERARESMRTRC